MHRVLQDKLRLRHFARIQYILFLKVCPSLCMCVCVWVRLGAFMQRSAVAGPAQCRCVHEQGVDAHALICPGQRP
jgi:hypothetical protein